MSRHAYSRSATTRRSARSTSPSAIVGRVRFAHVVERRIELAYPTRFVGSAETDAGLLGELHVHLGVGGADRRRLRASREALAPELAQRLELAVASARPGALRGHHRLVDERREQAGDVGLVDAVTGANALGAFEIERTREDREPLEQALLRSR